jgi:hypothetical protein
MTDLRDAARQALEALEFMADEWGFTQKANRPERWQAIEALKAALEQQGPAMKIPPPSNTDRPHYGQRDTLVQGNYFMRHMLAMTGESLHAKSAIAAELAHHHGGGQREQILVADAHDGAADQLCALEGQRGHARKELDRGLVGLREYGLRGLDLATTARVLVCIVAPAGIIPLL